MKRGWLMMARVVQKLENTPNFSMFCDNSSKFHNNLVAVWSFFVVVVEITSYNVTFFPRLNRYLYSETRE